MNSRMPYSYPTGSAHYHHNGYSSVPSWNERTDSAMNHSNWETNGHNRYTMNKKRNSNWPRNFNRNQHIPYPVPNESYSSRFLRNGYFNGNGHPQNWVQKTKPVNSPKNAETEKCIPGIIAVKKKRKPMSKSYPSIKWDEKDAEKAIQAEKDFVKNLKKQSLIIRFPDPELSKETVQKFHPQIESVHFPQSSTPRYCFAHLDENADIDKVCGILQKVPFGQGFLSVDIKKAREENSEAQAKDIDPYTLYVGNLPTNVTKSSVIQHFPGCTRIDIGHPQQLKNTRYAFVRFGNVDDAIKAYKNTRNTQFESRSLIVRFRRKNGNVGVPGENKQVSLKTKPEPTLASPQEKLTLSEKMQLNSTSIVSSSTANIVLADPIDNDVISPSFDLKLVKKEPGDDVDATEVLKSIPVTNGYDAVVKQEADEFKSLLYKNAPCMQNEDDFEHEENDEEYPDVYPYSEGSETYKNEDDYENEDETDSFMDLNDSFLPDDDDSFTGDE